MASVAEQLKQVMDNRSLTPEQVAEKSGLSPEVLRDLDGHMDIAVLEKISESLNVTFRIGSSSI
ncbi:helix-turn-helix domain-containing protein [Alteribacter natronophilus]|uniref:helix-turn-helix domain-containing protein n=1 Tax=Alteribacter natronophilus TaxID=2583810 RepID=UPI00110D547F|nr:helix-turn-helix transcriptional regulator [Alteribacter natronophilus]TMW71029.1 helix-turn-helix transcriptional regulator [Alteribacter natronophilus]